MGNVTKSQQNNITSPNGNSLAVFVDGITGVMKVKDIMGNIQPLTDFVAGLGTNPFEYNANATGIQSVLGTNDASGCYATIGGGSNNTASSYYATIGGGCCNTASNYNTTVGGGFCNTALGSCSTVGGGFRNSACGNESTVGGGCCNTASCSYATIGGGKCNTASGCNSGILGGYCNNTCGFANAMIIGSNLCATQSCTTFTNCVSANNLTVGCAVSVGTNKVLINSPFTNGGGLFAQTSNSTPITATTVESTFNR
jgi:hypothetical protein